MNLRDLAGIPLGLVAGAAMSVAVSCAWAVLHLPARLQDMFQAGSPRLFSWRCCWGCWALPWG